ncbi:MAG: DEAD/DEAH box helicase [Myxococcota bacterium]
MTESSDLCPPVFAWFQRRFRAATEPQAKGWPAIARGEDTLIAAPTGSGKTLAAFLMVLDRLFRRAIDGELEDRLEAVYVSPLRALSHDIQRNLEAPLEEIHAEAERLGYELPRIRAAVRTGDTSQAERQAMLRRPPHILVTTPESLYLLLTAERSRQILKSTRTVIVDEIHALARDKRGSHLSLSLERLEALADSRPARVGLSATQRPMDLIARFLVGARRAPADGAPQCTVIDLGHQRDLDLAIEVPLAEDLQGVASKEQWDDLLDVIAAYVAEHRTTLIFTNTRRLAERLAHRLGERVGEENVAAHHGSLARDRRLKVEQRLKDGNLRALVATGSLELGIDIGSVELVCQIGSPRSIATLLQRIGRSGHALGLRPRGRLFPTTRDELVECAALVRAIGAGRLDRIHPPEAPLDILAQQVVAACAVEEWGEDELFALVRGAYPYRALDRDDFDAVLEMLSQGFETPKGRRGVYVYRDRLQRRLRPRRGARLAAILSGGAIPETGDYRVVLDPEETTIGSVNEDWAIESMAGDVFLLGTHSWRIRRVESAVVRVVDAQGAPPTIPFWLGEAPARSDELSREVSELRADLASRVQKDEGAAVDWLEAECSLPREGALQVARYVRAQLESVGRVPTCEDLVVERFFDEAGGMQLVVHSPWGARINRGFALALRKRFCQSFNLELQAAATDDALVLSLGNPQTFPLETVMRFLSPKTVREVLEQALLASPLFTARWRWNVTRSLAVPRRRSGGRVPFAVQRMQADDLLGCVFPEQVACQENVEYPIAIPDHPLVKQTMHDCMTEAADIEGLIQLLERVEAGEVRIHCLDTVEPSPFTHEILNARPYAFLDDAPLEERRTRAVALRHVLPDEAQNLARLDPEAIERVRGEARPDVRNADELCELLVDLVVARPADLPADPELARELVESGRAARLLAAAGARLFAVERLGHVSALFPGAGVDPPVQLPTHMSVDGAEPEAALTAAVRGHLSLLGPTDSRELGERIGAPPSAVEAALARLEGSGIAVRGRFESDAAGGQFCDRSLLARIHRYTLVRLRKEIEPVSAGDFLSFLLRWQHVHPDDQLYGESGLLKVIEKLSGFEAAVAAWESGLLQARVGSYKKTLLDALCLSGSVAWGRLSTRPLEAGAQPSRATPIALFARDEMESLLHALAERGEVELRGPGERILELLRGRGALFARELAAATGLLPVQVDEGLKELVVRGLVTCDGFAPLRRLVGERPRAARRRRVHGRVLAGDLPGPEGRWGILRPLGPPLDVEDRAERSAWRLLRRYGVVFRDLLAREWIPEGWREVHRALRTLEARGLVRGGRFVSGFTGEQFALPEAVPRLRKERNRERNGAELRVSAADPLNLAGILTPGPRVPAGHARWLIYRDGLPVSAVDRGQRVELSSAAPEPVSAPA